MTTGAGNDIEHATEIARKMICEWGMSEKMGPVTFGKKDEQIFLGREMAAAKNFSEATAVDIDNEIRRIVEENYDRARGLLNENMSTLIRISQSLIEKENLTGAEVDEIIKKELPVASPAPVSETTGEWTDR
jgi:cell division protease FtsH